MTIIVIGQVELVDLASSRSGWFDLSVRIGGVEQLDQEAAMLLIEGRVVGLEVLSTTSLRIARLQRIAMAPSAAAYTR